MNYEDYKIASERHLETCLKLKDVVVANSLTDVDLKGKNEILANIYYLSGYVIECIVNYGMLVYINFAKISKEKKISSVYDLRLAHNKAKISYSPNDDNNAKYYLWRPSHKQFEAKPNIYFFKNEAKIENKELDKIEKKLTENNVKELFKKWDY